MTKSPKDIAEAAYKAYGKSTDNKNFQGNEMPPWAELPEAIQDAWVAAVKKVQELTEDDV